MWLYTRLTYAIWNCLKLLSDKNRQLIRNKTIKISQNGKRKKQDVIIWETVLKKRFKWCYSSVMKVFLSTILYSHLTESDWKRKKNLNRSTSFNQLSNVIFPLPNNEEVSLIHTCQVTCCLVEMLLWNSY